MKIDDFRVNTNHIIINYILNKNNCLGFKLPIARSINFKVGCAIKPVLQTSELGKREQISLLVKCGCVSYLYQKKRCVHFHVQKCIHKPIQSDFCSAKEKGRKLPTSSLGLTISPLNVCFQTLDPLNSSSSDNFDEKITTAYQTYISLQSL